MKNLIAGLILMLSTTISFAGTYECTGYHDGSKVGKPLTVNASKATVAETKAKARLIKSGLKVDYVECK